MPRKIIDLSLYPENDVISEPPPSGPKSPTWTASAAAFIDERMFAAIA